MMAEAANRMYRALHESAPYHDGNFAGWSKEPTSSAPYHYQAGVTIWVSAQDLTPDDKFLTPDADEAVSNDGNTP